mmetsp:Transcript_110126/g.322194  ORF Transcript_110126/g.322194 Transcript_110126/m.322194 type:complete len:205 (-) Transcript_110126:141-755(-)
MNVVRLQPDIIEVLAHPRARTPEVVLRISYGLAVHLVHADHQLPQAERVGQERPLPDLPLAGVRVGAVGRGDHQHGDVRLRHRGHRVLGKVVVAGRVYDREAAAPRGDTPEGHIHGATPVTLAPQLVQDPGVAAVLLPPLGRLARNPAQSLPVNRSRVCYEVPHRRGLPATARPYEYHICVRDIACLGLVAHVCGKVCLRPWLE